MGTLKSNRHSGIELLKVIALLLIVIGHTSQTLGTIGTKYDYLGCFIDMQKSTENIQYIILTLFRYFGNIGNNIFFVSSAWFLCSSNKKSSHKKVVGMLLDCWVISMVFLGVLMIVKVYANGIDVSLKDIIRSIFPTIFLNNWYVSCYVIFYTIFPWLNVIIRNMTKRELLLTNIMMSVIYYGIAFIYNNAFFVNNLIIFIVMYFLVAYNKLYLKDTFSDKKVIYSILLIGISGYIGIDLMMNFVGTKISFMSNRILRWNTMCNPFLFLIAISIFHIFRKINFTNKLINRAAGLSLLIYVTHSNFLFTKHIKPYIYRYIYIHFGYKYILLWILILSLIIFIGTFIISWLYSCTIQRNTKYLVQRFMNKMNPFFNEYIERMIEYK